MKKQCCCSFTLAGVNLTEFGLSIPSPFAVLQVNNSEQGSYTSWDLQLTIGGSSSLKMNVAAFEALIYSGAQSKGYTNASGIPVSFMFGWLANDGSVESYMSYQGWTISYSVNTSGQFLVYRLTGYASQAVKASMPVLNIPAVCGYVQPSAVVEGIAKAIKADSYYELDIDHSDAPTLVQHNSMTTSFTSYVKGERNGKDDYDSFPGLLPLSKTYNATREAAGLKPRSGKLSTILNHVVTKPISEFLVKSIVDSTPQCSSFLFWMDEPTMTKPGIIHYKSASSVLASRNTSALTYGTSDSNILTLSGSYDGVAYNMSDMNFATVGFTLDDTGNTIINDTTVVNSWSSSLADVYQTANIINDINALATQFSGEFTVTVAGSTKGYTLAEPVSLVVMSGNTLSPISGIYSIMSVSHSIGATFVTTLKLQRLSISSANQTAAGMGIYRSGSSKGRVSSFHTTPNIKSPGKVDFGYVYPTWQDIQMV